MPQRCGALRQQASAHLRIPARPKRLTYCYRRQHRLFAAIKAGHCQTWANLRNCAFTIREAEAQASIFDLVDAPPAPSPEERRAASRLERKIDLAAQVLGAGFDDGEIVAAKKIDPGRAATYADKLALMQRALIQMEHALRAGIALSLPLSMEARRA